MLRDDGESLEAHELLEILLFAGIPRRNTNDIAHALLDRYGSLTGVLQASAQELMQIDGIGESSAVMIRAVSALIRRMDLEKQEKPKTFDRMEDIVAYIKPLFSQLREERLYLLMFDDARHLLGCERISEGSTNAVSVNLPRMMHLVALHRASWVVLAHNHPNGEAYPSPDDVSTTRRCRDAFESASVQLVEHFVVSENQVKSIMGQLN